jgi:hypothetical protein
LETITIANNESIEEVKEDLKFLRYAAHANLGHHLELKHGTVPNAYSRMDALTEVTSAGGGFSMACNYVYNGQSGYITDETLCVYMMDYAKMKGILKERTR